MTDTQQKPDPGPAPAVPSDQAPTDTSTDWDEWMEEHAGRPRPRPDVADEQGKFTGED